MLLVGGRKYFAHTVVDRLSWLADWLMDGWVIMDLIVAVMFPPFTFSVKRSLQG
jgi:hypothetical protein